MKGIIMVKTEEDWKYQLFYNCISFIEWIDGLLLNRNRECFLVIMFYMLTQSCSYLNDINSVFPVLESIYLL